MYLIEIPSFWAYEEGEIMAEPILTAVAVGTLATIASDFIKGTAKNVKFLFKKDEAKIILNKAFQTFQDYCFTENKSKDEHVLLDIFKLFFNNDRTLLQFELVLHGKGHEVDFFLLEEVFASYCIEKGIDILRFDFFYALKVIIEEMEELAKQNEHSPAINLKTLYNRMPKRGTECNESFARFKYLYQLIRHNNRLCFAGIPDPREKKEIQLPSIFVMQRASETITTEDYRQMLRDIEEDENLSGGELHLRRRLPKERIENKPPVKFDQVMKSGDNCRFVVLGKPGSGKSSLLKYLMIQEAQKHLDHHRNRDNLFLPILIEIRKLERALVENKTMDFNILDYLYNSFSHDYSLRLPKKFFEAYLDRGRAFIMFDGLDEVVAEERRMEVQQKISAFIGSRHPGNRVIVTSRIAGYSSTRFSTTDYRHFTLEDFNDEEIKVFTDLWYRSRLENEPKAKTNVLNLMEALDKNTRIKELARNPLLLTIITIIHRNEAQLPEARLVLYDKATEAMLYTWDNVKQIIDERFKSSHRRNFLGKVAIHLQSLEKGDEAGTMIHRHELYEILLEDFCKLFCCEKYEAREYVDEFIDMIRLRAGLVVELAPDYFGFTHKTFQEYFAAKQIADTVIQETSLDPMLEYVDKFIDNAFWHETLLLAVRALRNKPALKVLKHILEKDREGIYAYLYHNHYFVMKFLAEQGQWLEDFDFLKQLVEDFFDFSWNDGRDRGIYNNSTWQRFEEWCGTVSDQLTWALLRDKLLPLAENDKEDDILRFYCARALGRLEVKDKAVNILLKLTKDEKLDSFLRRDCLETVFLLDAKDEAVANLLKIVEDDELDDEFRWECIYSLERLGINDIAIAQRLLAIAEDSTESIGVRNAFAKVAGLWGVKDKAVNILLEMAENETKDSRQQYFLARSLGELGVKHKAVEILLTLTEDENQDIDIRIDSAFSVGNMKVKKMAVVQRLLAIAEDDKQNPQLRQNCAEAAGQLESKDKAVDILLTMAEDKKQPPHRRIQCVNAVGELEVKDKTVKKRLTSMVEAEEKYPYIWLAGAETLWKMGVKDKAISLLFLVMVAVHSLNDPIRIMYECAVAMGKMGAKDAAIKILTKLYLDKEDKYEDEVLPIYSALWDLTAIQ